MIGLLQKDFFVITKQLKIFLILIIVFALIPNFFVFAFAVLYAALLPVTAIAYDERCKWDALAKTMPYTEYELILSKYIIGYIGVFAAAIITTICSYIIKLLPISVTTNSNIVNVFVFAMVGLILMAITLPLIFKFGVEKGRIAMIIVIASISAALAALQKISPATTNSVASVKGLSILLLATIAVNVVSVFLSVKIRK